MEDLSTLGTGILWSYRIFASSLTPDVLDIQSQIALDNRILLELSNRTVLAPYDREAFRLAQEYCKKFVRNNFC